MLASLGDLVEDVVVRLDGPLNLASDTAARISRRRGGSAANVAARAAELGHAVRFLGQVGDDAVGTILTSQLAEVGVDVSHVRRQGSTGTIVVLVDQDGERTMLSDRRASLGLSEPDPRWLDGVTVLHVPFYSLVGGPVAATAATVAGWARSRHIPVSIDLSSVAVLADVGVDQIRRRLAEMQPDVVFANADEAGVLDVRGPLGDALTVVKHGARPAMVHRRDGAIAEVPAASIPHAVDTTGAGDAFAAGFLTSPSWTDDPVTACRAGHRAAATLLRSRADR